jgi:hypothetical protein
MASCNLTTRVELPYPDVGADDWGTDFNAKIQLADSLIASLQDDNSFVGNQDITGTLDVTGAVDFDSTLNVDGAAVFGSTVRGTAFAVGIAPSLVAPYQLYSADIAATTAYYGLSIDIAKTTGASDAADHQYGVNVRYILNQVGGVTGHLVGGFFEVQVDNGATGAARDIIGVEGLLDLNTGTATQDVMGTYSVVDIEATFTTTVDVFGHRINVTPDGDVGGAVYGLFSYVDQAAGKTITGATYAAYLAADLDGTTTGSVYMLYLKEYSGVDYGIYQDGTAPNYFGGKLTGNGGFDIDGDVCIEDSVLYLGATTTTANKFRIYDDGTNLLFQRYESSTWVTKATIVA